MATGEGGLMAAIQKGLEEKISEKSQEIVERHKKQIGEEIDQLIREEVGNIGLRIARHSSIQMVGDTIRIEITDHRK